MILFSAISKAPVSPARWLGRGTVVALGLLLAGAGLRAEPFRAGVAKVDVTPDEPKQLLGYAARKSTGVHDRIHHRVLVLHDGTTELVIVSSDFCLISPAFYDRVAARLHREEGIPRVNFWWSLTHTHSAPEVGNPGLPGHFLKERYHHPVDDAYANFVEQALVNGVKEARSRLEPAKLGAGWGFSRANINRRSRDVGGVTSLGMNPDGPVDRKIGLIRLERTDGALLALVANYAIHGTVMGGANLLISGDAPGIVADYVEKKTGATMLFINGAAGNLAPIYSVYPTPAAGKLGQFRVLLGDRILEANDKIAGMTEKVKLRSDERVVETPRKEGMDWPEDLKDYERVLADGKAVVRLPVRFLTINDEVGIWGAPLELFCEVSNAVRDRSPFPYTFYFGYTNGWLGYLLTAEEIPMGGYEPRVSPFTGAAEADLREAVSSHLNGSLNPRR